MDNSVKLSELTFQSMIESVPNAIVLINKEGKIGYVNSQTERLFGYPRTELVGQWIEILIPRRYRDSHPDFRNSFFSSPSVRAMGAGRELFAVKKDSSEFPVEIGLNPLITADGTLVLASIIDITERKKAEERFKAVVESAPNAMVLVNKAGIIVLINAQTESLFGYSRSELVGSKLEKLIPKNFRTNHPDHRNNFFSSPSSRAMGEGRDLFALRKDNTEIQVEIGLNPLETNEGQMVLASIIDITERKKAEAELRESEQRFRTLVESVEDYAIFLVDVDGCVASWNEGARKIKQYTSDEILGKNISVFYLPEDVKNNKPFNCLKITREEGHHQFEGLRLRKDGSAFMANVVFTALYDDAGKLKGYVKITADITKQKRKEEELRNSIKEISDYKHALDQSSIVAITNQKGIITYANDNFCKISKYSKSELLGQDHRIINSGYHSKEFIKELWVTIANGQVWKGELKNRAKDGTIYWVDTTIIPFLNEQRKPYQYVAIRSDITEWKLQELIKNKVSELEIKNKELEQFTYIASHDLQEPLRTISNYIDVLREEYSGKLDAHASTYLNRINSATGRMQALVKGLLDYSRLGQERKLVYLDCKSLLKEVISDLQNLIQSTRTTISIEDLPALYVYETELRQLFQNMISNAIKFRKPYAIPEITIGCRQNRDVSEFFISDNGIGIDPKDSERIFHIFQRLHLEGQYDGHGIGLANCKKIAELHGGNIRVESEVNKGTTFYITISNLQDG